MFDDLAAYFYENVVTAYNEYVDVKDSGMAGRSRDVRTAINAATVLYHLREHLPPNKKITVDQIFGQCPDYSIIRDIVNVSKHGSITRYASQISKAEQIHECAIITDYCDEEGTYKFVEKNVYIHLLNGTTRDMLEVLTNVMNFWQNYLYSIGVIANSKCFDLSSRNKQPKSRAECEGSSLALEILQGVRFKQVFCWQRYNYETARVEPVDLTGYINPEMRIYKPSYEIDLKLTHEKSGQEITRTLSLTEEESLQLFKLKTDKEKQEFCVNLPSFRNLVTELQKDDTGETE